MTKRIKVYVHRSKESNFELEEKFENSDLLYLGYEVEIYYDINPETGEAKLVGADGFFLSDEPVTKDEFDWTEA